MLIFRTQDFMTGVPAIPGKHLSIELVSKMVGFQFLAAKCNVTFPGERDWYCARHIQGALRPDQQAAWNHLLGINLHRPGRRVDVCTFIADPFGQDYLKVHSF